MICKKCGANTPDNEDKCRYCGEKIDNTNNNNNGGQRFKILPMKWYKFLTLILLPISAFSNMLDGIQLVASPDVSLLDIEGLGDVSTVALEKLNVFSGICMIIIAAFMIYTCGVLRKMKKISLLCVSSIYIANTILNTVYGGLMLYILGAQALDVVVTLIFINALVALFMIIVNTVYFNKRKHFFVN